MTGATLTSKGQITIPAAVREKLGLSTGDRVEFVDRVAAAYECEYTATFDKGAAAAGMRLVGD